MLIAGPTGEVKEISAGGPPLGILANANFPEERHACLGCGVLMFTDGLMEALNLKGDLLGLDKIKAELASATRCGESNEATKLRFVRLLETFQQGAPPADDTAFIVIVTKKTIANVKENPHRR